MPYIQSMSPKSFGSKVWPRCELYLSNEESQTDTQTWQKLDAPKFHSLAIKPFQTEITSNPNFWPCAKYMLSPMSTYLPQNWQNIKTKSLWNTMPPVVTRSVKKLFQHNGYDQGHEVGWLNWRFTSLQRYFSHIATWKQEITNLWNSSGEAGNWTPDLLLRKPRA